MVQSLSERASGSHDDMARARFIESLALVLAESGIPRMPARVFAGLLATDSGSSTASELAELLQVSPAAISGAVRYLTQIALIRREREPGSRRDHYALRENVWSEIIEHRNRELVRWQDTIAQGIEALGPGTPASARLAEMHTFFDFLHDELQVVMDAWHRRTVERAADRTA